MLDIHGLSKTFEAVGRGPAVAALDDVDLAIAQGEFTSILGPSGCGKTTLLRTIAGFETPDIGTIDVGGRQVCSAGQRPVPAHDRGIGLVPQDGALFPHLTVAQNIGFGLRGWGRRKRRARVDEVLDLVSLGEYGRRRPHELSGGQQQRVALARAIAPNPGIVLLDEPFSALDAYLRESLRSEVRELLKSIGATVLLVTHDQAEALTMGDRIVAMREGQVIQTDDPRMTYSRPLDIELARFLGDALVVDGTIGCGDAPCTVSCPFGNLPIASWHGEDGPCTVLIRPENIQVNEAAQRQESTAGLVGTIVGQEYYGHDSVIKVNVPQLNEPIPVRVFGEQTFGLRDTVHLAVDSAVCTYPR